LGLWAIAANDIPSAKKFLLAASQSPGSPQLDTFGPDFSLADALLKLGAANEVLDYLRGIKQFWEMDYGVIQIWIAQIESGKRPVLSKLEAMLLSIEGRKR
jgi:hypothetical protein